MKDERLCDCLSSMCHDFSPDDEHLDVVLQYSVCVFTEVHLNRAPLNHITTDDMISDLLD